MNIQNLIIQYFRFKILILSLFSKKLAGNKAFNIFCTPFFRMAYKDNLLQNTERISLSFQGLTTTGYRWNKGAGKKLLIAHGFRSASVNFKHLAEILATKNYEVIAFDAPAHGLSQGKTINALQYKNFISSVNENFGPFDVYLAHSFGGLAVCLHLEEIDNSSIKNVLIAPAANTIQLCNDFFKALKINDPTLKKNFFNNINALSKKSPEWFSINRAAQNIKSATLWIHDYDDKVTPIDDALELQQKHLPNFHFIFTSNLGHRRIYHDEKVAASIVAFL